MPPSAPDPAARLAAIVESSNDAIVSEDLNGIITSWNHAAERMFGYTAAEAIGHSITMLIPIERISEETRTLATVRAGRALDHFETVRRQRGEEFVFQAVGFVGLRVGPRILHRERRARGDFPRELQVRVGVLAP